MKKKWSVLLSVLCALLAAIGLFACKKTESADSIERISKLEYNKLSVETVSYTDNQTWSDILADLNAKIKLTVKLVKGETTTLTGADCTITHTIGLDSAKHCEVGRYTITIMPKANNPKKQSRVLTAEITHAFSKDGEREVCTYCKATKISSVEDVVIHYGAFHSHGSLVADVTKEGYAPEGGVTDGTTAAYTNRTEGRSYIEQFGKVQHTDGSSYDIPTLTAGKLEPGMTITVKGKAQTAWEKWHLEKDAGYYFPVIGIADRTNNNPNWDGGEGRGYDSYNGGGTSVFVRGEGWVLYNGIDATHTSSPQPRMLSALGSSTNGSGETRNYGSLDTASHTDSEHLPEHYVQGKIPNASEWTDWIVYSTGEASPTTRYTSLVPIELTWKYREDGVIELVYSADGVRLLSYIKVPASSTGYYDTMLHGDYVDMYIESYERIETRTPNAFKITVDEKDYFEGEMLDPSTVAATFQYEQTGSEWYPQALTLENFYATTEVLTKEQAQTAVDNGEISGWKSLATNALSTAYKTFIVKVEKGGENWVEVFSTDKVHVVKNAIAFASGADVGTFKNYGTVGALTVSTDGSKIKLTPVGAVYGQKIDDGSSFVNGVSDYTAYRFVALYLGLLEGKELGTTDISIKSGTTNVPYLYDASAQTLVLALSKTTTEIEIDGVNETTTILDMSNIKGFGIEATITQDTTGNGWMLNNDSNEVTVTFEATDENELYRVYVEGSYRTMAQLNSIPDNGYAVGGSTRILKDGTSYNADTGVATVHIRYGAANLAAYEGGTISIRINNKSEDEFVYKLDYKAEFVSDAESMDGGYYNYAAGGKVYLAKVATSGYTGDNSLGINVNEGNENVALLNLAYTYDATTQKVAFKNADLKGVTIKVITIAGEPIILIEIDRTAYGMSGSQFGYQLMNGQTYSDSYYAVSNNAAKKFTASGADKIVVKEGTCLEFGLAGELAKAEVNEVAVSFLANVSEFGGSHKFAKVENNAVCQLCGEPISRQDLSPALGAVTLHENEFVELNESYQKDFGFTQIYNGVTIKLTVGDDWYWIRNDGYVGFNDYGVAAESDDFWTSFGDDIGQRTPAGKLDADGEEITETSFIDAMKARAVVRIWAGYQDGTVTIIWRLYKSGDAVSVTGYTDKVYFEFTHKILNVTQNTVSLAFGLDNARIGNNTSSTVWAFKGPGKIDKNMITSAATADGSVSLTVGNIVDHYATVTATGGNATDMDDTAKGLLGITGDTDYKKYVAVQINLEKAYTSGSALAKVYDKDGKLVEGAAARFGDDDTHANDTSILQVIVALKDGETPGVYYVHLANSTGSTLQCDIKLDLTAVSVHDLTATVTNTAHMVSGGDITIVYAGTEANNAAKVQLNDGTAVDLGASMDLGNGITATWSATDHTLKVTLPASELTGIPQYTVALLDGTGKVLATSLVQVTELPVAGAGVTQIEAGEVYTFAKGDKMYVYLFGGAATGKDYLVFNANNASTAKNVILPYSLAYKFSGTAVVFKEDNGLTKTANYYVEGSTKVVQIAIDLSYYNIAADAAYFFELLTAPITTGTTYYTVAANRSEVSATTVSSLGTKEDIIEVSCTADGSIGYEIKDNDTVIGYYGVELVKGGHLFPAEGGLCTRCKEVTGWTTDVEVGVDASNGGNWAGWTFAHGAGKAWNPANLTDKFSSILPGQKVVAEGILKTDPAQTNNWNGIAALLYPADNFIDGMHLRIDSWINNASGQATLDAYKLNVVKSHNNEFDLMKVMRTNANLTITWDWTNKEQIVVKILVEGIDTTGSFWCAYTFTPFDGAEFAPQYSIGIGPDLGYFKGTVMATASKDVVPADKCNPVKHEHKYDQTTDICWCGKQNPSHTHNYDPATHKCAVDGAIDPDVSKHPDLTNGVCNVCGAYMFDKDTLEGVGAKQTMKNGDVTLGAWNGDGGTWDTPNGDFAIRLTYTQTQAYTDNLQWAALRFNGGGAELVNIRFFTLNGANWDCWGTRVGQDTMTVKLSKTEGEDTTNWTGDDVKNNLPTGYVGSYEVFAYRVGNALEVICNYTTESGTVWTITYSWTSFAAGTNLSSAVITCESYYLSADLDGYVAPLTAKQA